MRVLVLTPFLPYATAPSGCPRAVFDRLRLLSPVHRLSVVCFVERGEEGHIEDLREMGIDIHMTPRDVGKTRRGFATWQKRGRLAVGLCVGGRPVLAQEFRTRGMRHLIRRVVASNHFDVILVEHILMAQYLDGLTRVEVPPFVLSDHDTRMGAPATLPPKAGPRALLHGLDRRAWLRHRVDAWGRATAVTVPTVEDAAVVTRLAPAIRLIVIPFGLAIQPDPGPPLPVGDRGEDALLFVGNFNHPPNVDAALWLCRDILPLVRRVRPMVKLWLVGKDPPPEVRSLASGTVTVTGEAPAVAPYLRRCAVFVAPLRQGGGTRMKIIEALAAGAPIVTTTLGARGLDAIAGEHLLVADDAGDVAAAISRLVEDHALRRALGAAGQRFIHDPDRALRRSDQLNTLLCAVGSRGVPGPSAAPYGRAPDSRRRAP